MGESGFSIRKLSKAIREQTTDATGKPARGSSYTSLRDFIHGVVDEPRPNILEEAAKALGVSSDWLIRGEGSPTDFDRDVVELSATLVGTGDLRADIEVGETEGRGEARLPRLGTVATGTSQGTRRGEDGHNADVSREDKRRATVVKIYGNVVRALGDVLEHEPSAFSLSNLAYIVTVRMGSLIKMLKNEVQSLGFPGGASIERLPRHYIDDAAWLRELFAVPDENARRHIANLPMFDDERVAREVAQAIRAPMDVFGIDPKDLSHDFMADYLQAMQPIILSLARIRPADDDAGDDVRVNYRGVRERPCRFRN